MDLQASALSKGQATAGSRWARGCKDTELHRQGLPCRNLQSRRDTKAEQNVKIQYIKKGRQKRPHKAGAQHRFTTFSNALAHLFIFPQTAGRVALHLLLYQAQHIHKFLKYSPYYFHQKSLTKSCFTAASKCLKTWQVEHLRMPKTTRIPSFPKRLESFWSELLACMLEKVDLPSSANKIMRFKLLTKQLFLKKIILKRFF